MIEASCHCGAVRIELAAVPESLTECNCSICRRLGVVWAYYPPSDVAVACQPEATRGYVWGDACLAFHSCTTCGCTTHAVGTGKIPVERMNVNARLLDPALLEGVPMRHFDGADSWEFLD